MPTLLFLGVWLFVIRRMGGAQGGLLAIGKSKAKVYVEHSTGVTFDDVAGIDEARGDVSTGAQDDLQRATDIARQMITSYGFEPPRQGLFLQVPTGGRRSTVSGPRRRSTARSRSCSRPPTGESA